MSTLTAEPVDEDGNIVFGPTEGISVPIKEVLTNGTEVNISTALRFFNCNGIKIALALDPSNALGRLLLLTPAQLTGIPGSTANFSVSDEDGVVPVDLWTGTIMRRN